jgi:hypothetical protein
MAWTSSLNTEIFRCANQQRSAGLRRETDIYVAEKQQLCKLTAMHALIASYLQHFKVLPMHHGIDHVELWGFF